MLIRLHNIGKTYRTGGGDVQALQGIDLSIERGEFAAIIGQSGSGKTTLLDILGCLSQPTEGDYWLDDRAVGSLSDRELAVVRNQQIGFIFQIFHLLPRKSALHNVELPLQYAGIPAQERRRRAIETLRLVGLQDRLAHWPNQLSGGQQQRVAIARALVNRPAILLADEPTGSLDQEHAEETLERLLELQRLKSTALVLVTHNLTLARRMDRSLALEHGTLAGP